MDVSELRKRILRALEDARHDASERRTAVDHAAKAYEEFLEIEWVTLGWLMDELRSHRLPDVKTQLAVHWLDRLFSGAWPWPPFDL